MYWAQMLAAGCCSPLLILDAPSFSVPVHLVCICASGMMCAVDSLSPLRRFPDESIVANASCGGNLYSEPLNTPSIMKLVLDDYWKEAKHIY